MMIVSMVLGTILFFMSFKFVTYFTSSPLAFIGLWIGFMGITNMILESIF